MLSKSWAQGKKPWLGCRDETLKPYVTIHSDSKQTARGAMRRARFETNRAVRTSRGDKAVALVRFCPFASGTGQKLALMQPIYSEGGDAGAA